MNARMQKVPPSGVAPVFKLTLPHSVVHTHMVHLIDKEFDIATSATAPQTWHGRISPRRNKSRSEYTLQVSPLLSERLCAFSPVREPFVNVKLVVGLEAFRGGHCCQGGRSGLVRAPQPPAACCAHHQDGGRQAARSRESAQLLIPDGQL